MRWLKAIRHVLTGLVLIGLTIYFGRAFDSLRQPDLRPWHELKLEAEYRLAEDGPLASFDDYLEIEDRVFEELESELIEKLSSDNLPTFSRFDSSGPMFPGRLTRNWNRSFELRPKVVVGGVVLIHGLTDSPYSMRSLARIFEQQGYRVVAPRMPGHGTTPGGLQHVDWEDWMAVVVAAVRHTRQQIGPEHPLMLGGYSNGGALTVKYVLDSIDDEALETPSRVFLWSPAIAVTRFAALANLHKALSWVSYFERFAWEGIQPEFDPFKYNSFAKHAGWQSHRISKAIGSQLDRLTEQAKLEGLPDIYTFQSIVDATVLTNAVVRGLHDRLPPGHGELIVFGVNRVAKLEEFISPPNDPVMWALRDRLDLPFALTHVTNRDPNSLEVVARHRTESEPFDAGTPLGLSWPPQVYSLSHVALPIPPDDPFYGRREHVVSEQALALGDLRPRGEKGILRVPVAQLMRLRFNPFFPYIERRLVELLAISRERPGPRDD